MVNPRGTDTSDHPADRRSYSLANYASDLEELRAHLGLKRIDLLGHSHGGMVAIVYAATHPERVGRLILSNTIARQPTEELTRWEQQVLEAKRAEPWYEDAKSAWAALNEGQFAGATELAELLLREQPLHFARYGSAEQSYVDRLRSEMPNRALVLLRRGIGMAFDLRPELRRIRARTLVITGDQDTNGPPAAEEIARAIPGGELVVIQNCGHFAFVEAPERFRAEVLAFLALD